MKRALKLKVTAVLVTAIFLAPISIAKAQFTVSDTDHETALDIRQLSAEERGELLARLSDEEVRELFLGYMETGSPGAELSEGQSPMERLDGAMGTVRDRLAHVLERSGELLQVPGYLLERASTGLGSRHFYFVVLVFMIIALVGYSVERFYKRGTAGAYRRLSDPTWPRGDPRFVGRFLGRLALDLIGVAVFALVILLLFFVLYRGHEPTRLLVGALFTALLAARLGVVLTRAVLTPGNASLRVLPLGDEDAVRLYRWSIAAIGFGSFWFSFDHLLLDLGIEDDLFLLLRLIGGTILLLLVIACLAIARRPVAEVLSSRVAVRGRDTALRQTLARQWHLAPLLYLVAIYLISVASALVGWKFGANAGLWSLVVVAVYPLADFIMAGLVRGFFGPADPQRPIVAPIFVRAARIVVLLLAVVLFVNAWGIEIFASGDEAILGGQVAAAILQVGATVLVAYVFWGVAKLAFLRYVGETMEDAGADEGASAAAAATRLQTIMPLLLRFFQITLIAMVVMILLSSMGVDIGPLLAGAGVVGIAIGFGAQTLVRDVVSGLFFLLDDAFRKGEYVDIGSVKGTVENINVRSLVLRHHLGPIHTVPFGEIHHLTNFSRDWVIMKLEFRVPTDTDLNQVKKIFKKIGAEMLEHPELGKDFIEPFKSQGVKAIEDSAIIVRGKFMCRPGRQFLIRKELYNRVQMEFQAAGLQFAHRKVTVELPPSAKLTEEQKEKVAEAAGAAARGIEEPQAKPSN